MVSVPIYSEWFDPDSWDLSRIPTIEDDVYIDLPNHCTIENNGIGAFARNIYLGIDGIGTLNNRGFLRVTNKIVLGVNFASLGSLTIFSIGSLYCDEITIGEEGDGSLSMFGGNAEIPTVKLKGIIMITNNGQLETDEIRPTGGLIALDNGGTITECN